MSSCQKKFLDSEELRLIEIFESVQGETTTTGLPTTFIRLAACNLRCTWCDTTYSFGKGVPFSLNDIWNKVETYGHRHICVTGGEPLLQQNVLKLMTALCDHGYIVNLETGGSLTTEFVDARTHIILDIKCPDSGMSSKNYWENLSRLRMHDEVKFVINSIVDYDYAKEIVAKYTLFEKTPHVLFSPVHGKLDSKELVSWILRDRLHVRLNLQTHKFIWAPETRGV